MAAQMLWVIVIAALIGRGIYATLPGFSALTGDANG
jgi:hypothetical protein